MAVARLDTAVSTQVVASGTLAYTVGAGSDRALIVTLANETNGNTTHDSVLYGDQSMVKMVDTATGTSGFTQRTSIWILLDAEIDAASSNVIDPTFGTTQPADLQIHAASYTGVDQTGGATTYPDTNGASATASTPNPLVSDITGVADGAVVAARGCGNNTTHTWQADLTEQTDQSDASSSSSFADALTSADGNVNVDGTAASQNRGAQSAAALAPASADLDITVPVGNIDTDGLAPSSEIEHNRAVPVGTADTLGLLPTIAIDTGSPTIPVPNTELHLVTFVGLFLNGQAPTISIVAGDVTVEPLVGDLSLTGLVPGLAIDVGVPEGNIDTDGLIPSSEIEHIRQVPVGAADLTGLAPGILADVAMPVGNIDTDGLAPSAEIIHNRAVPAGSAALEGLEPAALIALSVPVGNIDTAGLAPTAEIEHNRAVPAGQLTTEGLSLGIGIVIGVPTGSLSMEGLQPTAEIDHIRIIPTVTELLITPIAPSAEITHIRGPPQGALALTGEVPVADAGDNVVEQPQLGELDLLGLQPSAEITHTRQTSVGSLTLTPLLPSSEITHTRQVPVGSLSITGQAPVALSGDDRVSQPDTGTLTLTPLLPTIDVSVNIVAPLAGSLILAGKTPALEIIINNADSSLFFTGQAPTPLHNVSPPDVITSPGVGSLVLTGLTPKRPVGLLLKGFAPTVFGDFQVLPGSGALTLTGLAPERVANNIVDMGVGALSLTGLAPSIPFLSTPPAGALTIIPLQPRIEGPQLVEPGTGSLILTGLVPGRSRSDEIEEGEQPSGGHGWRNQYDAQVQRRRVGRRKRRRRRRDIEAISDKVDREIARHFRKDTERAERDQEVAAMLDIVKVGYDFEQFAALDETLGEYYLRAREKGTFSAVEAFERKLEEIIEEEEFLLLALLSL